MKTPILILTITISAVFLGACTGERAAETKTAVTNANVVANADSTKNTATLPADFVSDEAAVKKAVNVGAKMPAFALKDIDGKLVSSDELLKKGNLVVTFYRGAWCPYCNMYLQNLQKNAADIKAAGGEIVAISVENPDKSTGVAKKNDLQFTVLSDPQLEAARKFGIVYQLPPETDEKYKSKGLDVAKNNEMERAELPLGATYIVNQKGEIVYAYLDKDYTKRAEPSVIVEELKKIKTGAEKK